MVPETLEISSSVCISQHIIANYLLELGSYSCYIGKYNHCEFFIHNIINIDVAIIFFQEGDGVRLNISGFELFSKGKPFIKVKYTAWVSLLKNILKLATVNTCALEINSILFKRCIL